jgi:hypothetical protein
VNHPPPLTLFIIKKFYDYNGHYHVSSGLRLSAQFVVDMLLMEGHNAKLVVAIDGNSIDALVAQNKPTRVVLEAIWVTPSKMAELQRLWPKVKWTVRVHSETPFLAQEGQAVGWIVAYQKQGVEVAFNSSRTVGDFAMLGPTAYLPNYYPIRQPRWLHPLAGQIDIGCFGAIRPLKNQLIQAVAAIQYAKRKRLPLFFHMNGTRIEQDGNNNLKNIVALFAAAGSGFTLQLHPWSEHEDFLPLVSSMDMCLCVSFTESFCIVASDAVSMGVPLVGSEAIQWLPERSQADVNSVESILEAMHKADQSNVHLNQHALRQYLRNAVATWERWLQ